MHHIYHTEGIILGSRNYGDSGKYFYILTRDLGLVMASASGVRKLSSRLRYILQDYSYIKVDLVRGKDFWRITTASKTEKLENFSKNIPALQIFMNIARLLKRLLPGEDTNGELFAEVVSGMEKLERAQNKNAIGDIEVELVLRILANLGYIGGQKVEHLLKDAKRGEILLFINKILNETQL